MISYEYSIAVEEGGDIRIMLAFMTRTIANVSLISALSHRVSDFRTGTCNARASVCASHCVGRGAMGLRSSYETFFGSGFEGLSGYNPGNLSA